MAAHEVELYWGAETPNAIKVRVDSESPWFFLPKSQVEFERFWKPSEKHERVRVEIPEWLLIKEGLEHLV
ncbi:MAG TPA: hypothetical protein VMJ73_12180 [Rhizomicrobium sp.]|nr:hypothetical protein [Rhizomicrobium sp.]